MFLTKTIWKFSAFCINQEGNGYWAVYYPSSSKFFNPVFLFVGLTTFGTFIGLFIELSVQMFQLLIVNIRSVIALDI